MKKIVIILACILAFALPASVFATDAPPEGAAGGTMQMEFRYASGETPDIPQTIDRFGFTYHLVSVSDPMLEGDLPAVRTYTYRVDGALTPEQKDSVAGLGDLTLTPVNLVFEEEVDKTVTIPMKRNDVDSVPEWMEFTVTSGTAAGGYEDKMLQRTGVTFELANPQYDKYGKPAGYIATAVYRGIQTFSAVGYYLVEATFSTSEAEEGEQLFVVIAEYSTGEMPPPIDEEPEIIVTETVMEPEGTGTGLSTIDDGLVALQSGNLIKDLMEGLVPLGGFRIYGVWSFLSLMLAVGAVTMAALLAAGAAFRSRRVANLANLGVEEERLALIKRRGIILRLMTIVFGLITLVSWLYLDDFSFGMVWVNYNTVMVAILFVVTLVLCILTNLRNKKVLKDDEEDEVEEFIPDFNPAMEVR